MLQGFIVILISTVKYSVKVNSLAASASPKPKYDLSLLLLLKRRFMEKDCCLSFSPAQQLQTASVTICVLLTQSDVINQHSQLRGFYLSSSKHPGLAIKTNKLFEIFLQIKTDFKFEKQKGELIFAVSSKYRPACSNRAICSN